MAEAREWRKAPSTSLRDDPVQAMAGAVGGDEPKAGPLFQRPDDRLINVRHPGKVAAKSTTCDSGRGTPSVRCSDKR